MSRSTVLALFVASSLRAAGPSAGTAACDITPPVGYPMWGYAARHDRPSVGVLDPLKARALVLTADDTSLAFVSLDLGRAPHRASMARLRARLKPAGIEHLFVVASHTHHGPVLELDTWPDPEKPYTRHVEGKVEEIVVAAAKAAAPCRWGVASREVPLNRNRHSKLTQPPVDRTLTVLRVESHAGKPLAHLVNFAAHPTLTDAKTFRFSADYPGALAAHVEAETGVPCLFLQGAAGDLSPNPPTGISGPAEFGQVLAKEVLALAAAIRCEATATEMAVRNEELRFATRFDVTNPLVKFGLSQAFFPDLVAFYEREYAAGVRPTLTTAVLGGRVGIVGVSGELFCGHALSLRRRARLDHVIVCGYCNDYQQYFPTIEAAAEGGYGAAPPVGLAEVGAGERIVDTALKRLFQLRGKLKGD